MTENVVVVDDNEAFAEAARSILEHGGMRVIGTARTPGEAMTVVRETHPDVVLLDVHLGSSSGLDLARDLVADGRRSPVVIMMSTAPADDVVPLLRGTPASGFVPKIELAVEAIAAIIRTARTGRSD